MGGEFTRQIEEANPAQTIDDAISTLLDNIADNIANAIRQGFQETPIDKSFEDVLYRCYSALDEALGYFIEYKFYYDSTISSAKGVIGNIKNIINGVKEESIGKKRAEKNLEKCLHSCKNEEDKAYEKIEYYKQRLLNSFNIIESYANKIFPDIFSKENMLKLCNQEINLEYSEIPDQNKSKYKPLIDIRNSVLNKLTKLG